MKNNSLEMLYFDWLYEMACGQKKCHKGCSFRRLLKHLHSRDFCYIIERDENRAQDGLNLRQRFIDHVEYDQRIFDEVFDSIPVSVLEMILSLVLRAEENFMTSTQSTDNIERLFWEIIDNIGLYSITDEKYEQSPEIANYVDRRIDILLNREYDPDGIGGMFFIPNIKEDLTQVEIWYQLCWYLNTH